MSAAHPNAALVTTFYRAFQERDAATMAACYAPGVRFRDPVFAVDGARAGAMWHMLCERGTDLVVEFSNIAADELRGSADWVARYTFGAAGRPVVNRIHAEFRFDHGFIAEHTDTFDLHRWAAQALGLKGLLLGWTPLVQNAIRRTAARALDAFEARRATS